MAQKLQESQVTGFTVVVECACFRENHLLTGDDAQGKAESVQYELDRQVCDECGERRQASIVTYFREY